MNDIEKFIQKLSEFVLPNTINLYKGKSPEAQIRRDNLSLYLTRMKKLSPTILLLNDCPEKNGSAWTGIPITCEEIIAKNKFFKGRGYKIFHSHGLYKRDRSTVILWNQVNQYAKLPLLWHLFPLNPINLKRNNERRAPKTDELNKGVELLSDLLKIFNVQTIGMIGSRVNRIINNKKNKMLIDSSIKLVYMLHPYAEGIHNDKLRVAGGIAELMK